MEKPQEPQSNYELLSPTERNQELKKIFTTVPSTKKMSREELIAQLKQGIPEPDNVLMVSQTEKLIKLLNHSFLTPSAKRQTVRTFVDMFELGIPEEFHEIEISRLGEILGYNDDSNPGGFGKETSEDVDRAFYKLISDGMLTGRALSESVKNDPAWKKIMSAFKDQMFLNEMQKGVMSDEELRKVKEQEELDRTRYQQYLENISTWRQEFIKQYQDEP